MRQPNAARPRQPDAARPRQPDAARPPGPTTTKSILLVVHGLPPDENTGTPLVAYGYATALAEAGWSVTVMAMEPDAPPWDRLQVRRRAGEPFDRVAVQPTTGPGSVWTVDAPSDALYAAAVSSRHPTPPAATHDQAITALLGRLAPSVVHVIDNVHLPLSIPEIAHRLGIPVVRTVACAEDLCALIAPVSPCSGPAGYCPAPLTVEHCAACVAATAPTNPAWVHFAPDERPAVDRFRRERLRGLLQTKRARAVAQFTGVFDRVVFASPGFRAYFEQTLALPAHRTRTIPMGVDVTGPEPPRTTTGAKRADTKTGPVTAEPGGIPGSDVSDPLTFVLLATADPAKGVGAVIDTFTHPEITQRRDWRLVLAGGGERSSFGALLDNDQVVDHGPFAPGDLAGLLGGAQVGLSTSVFETFHRVTREYLAGGLAVVGAATFGITDVVADGVNGILFDHRYAGSLRQAVLSLLADRPLVDRLRHGARATAIRSVAEEVAELEVLYRELLARPAAPAPSGQLA